jgi:hypothetical protein
LNRTHLQLVVLIKKLNMLTLQNNTKKLSSINTNAF